MHKLKRVTKAYDASAWSEYRSISQSKIAKAIKTNSWVIE